MANNPSAPMPPVAHLEFKVAALLLLMLLLVGGSVVYVMYARGVFEPTQQLVLVADDSEGVKVGMDLTFSGFPIGRCARCWSATPRPRFRTWCRRRATWSRM